MDIFVKNLNDNYYHMDIGSTRYSLRLKNLRFLLKIIFLSPLNWSCLRVDTVLPCSNMNLDICLVLVMPRPTVPGNGCLSGKHDF